MKYDLTVAIPTYNRENFLDRAIKSVLNQKNINLQLIIFDNNSIDNTEILVKKYLSDPRVSYYKNSFNVGAVQNYNKCLEKSDGEYFMILGDDDWLSENYGFELIDSLNGEDAIFVGKCIAMSKSGVILNESVDYPFTLDGLEAYEKIIKRDSMVIRHAWFMLAAKTEAIRNCGGFPNTELGQHSDNMLLFELLLTRQIRYRPTAINYYSVYPESYGNSNIPSVAIATLQFINFWDFKIAPKLLDLKKSHKLKPLRESLIRSLTLLYIGRVFKFGGKKIDKINLIFYYPSYFWIIKSLFSILLLKKLGQYFGIKKL